MSRESGEDEEPQMTETVAELTSADLTIPESSSNASDSVAPSDPAMVTECTTSSQLTSEETMEEDNASEIDVILENDRGGQRHSPFEDGNIHDGVVGMEDLPSVADDIGGQGHSPFEDGNIHDGVVGVEDFPSVEDDIGGQGHLSFEDGNIHDGVVVGEDLPSVEDDIGGQGHSPFEDGNIVVGVKDLPLETATKSDEAESELVLRKAPESEAGEGEHLLDDASVMDVLEGENADVFSRCLQLPEGTGKNVILLQCESNAPGGVCFINIIGTAHVSKASCTEVQAVIRHVKPQVVFLELCASRVAILLPQKIEVPTFSKMLELWKKKEMNLFGLIYSWFLAKVGEKMEVLPGTEFRVGYEEAVNCGAKVTLGDRPVKVTLQRTWAKMGLWSKVKFLFCVLSSSVFMPSAEELAAMMEKMEDNDEITFMIQELSKTFPTLSETLIHERDLYMVASLRSVARQCSSVVAVIGRGHLTGIANNWKEDICVEELLSVPKKGPSIRLGLWSAVAVLVGGVSIVAGVHYMHRR